MLKNGYRVLDVCCGEGEFLIRVAERYHITEVGLDCSPDCIAIANEKVQVRFPRRGLALHLSRCAVIGLKRRQSRSHPLHWFRLVVAGY